MQGNTSGVYCGVPKCIFGTARVIKEDVRTMMDQFLILGWPPSQVQLAALWVPYKEVQRFPADFPELMQARVPAGYQLGKIGRADFLRIGPEIWLRHNGLRDLFLARARGADRRANRENMARLLLSLP